MRRLPAALVCAVVVAAALPARASPARGVSIDLGRVDITQKLTPGGGYALPTMHVRNPGTVRTTYVLTASYVAGQHGKRAPASWFRFHPATLTLNPGESKAVETKLALPVGAAPGSYEALLVAQVSAPGAGAHVGAAAAAPVTFTVEPATLLDAIWERVKSFFSDTAPWSWLVPVLVIVVVLLDQGRRRFSIRVERRS